MTPAMRPPVPSRPFTWLLASLLTLLLSSPFLGRVEAVAPVTPLLFFVVLLFALWAAGVGPRLFQLCSGLACAGLLYHGLLRLGIARLHWPELYAVAPILFAACLALAILGLARRLAVEALITADTVRGGIAIYLLIGCFWALVFRIVTIMDPAAFTLSAQAHEFGHALLYFSFSTLTTLGYGDVLPLSDLARTLAVVEAIVGQIYLTVFIARLVGFHLVQEFNRKNG